VILTYRLFYTLIERFEIFRLETFSIGRIGDDGEVFCDF
jgi:hypothetical protein